LSSFIDILSPVNPFTSLPKEPVFGDHYNPILRGLPGGSENYFLSLPVGGLTGARNTNLNSGRFLASRMSRTAPGAFVIAGVVIGLWAGGG
jgi:hypothetical protein